MIKILWRILSLTLIFGCSEPPIETAAEHQTLFSKIQPTESGVDFRNDIQQNQYFNLFKWKYIYNGAGVATGDINNDGRPDIYLASNTGPNKLFLNKGNFEFQDVTLSAGVAARGGYKTGVAMVDLNSDGYLDIFVCRDADQNPQFRNNLILLNNGDTTFTQANSDLGMLDESYTTQALFLDFDRDQDLDIVLINHPDDFDTSTKLRIRRLPGGKISRDVSPTSEYTGIKFYVNEEGKFIERSGTLGINHQGFGLGGIVADFNKDGWLDFFIANDFLEPDFLFINQNGEGFEEKASHYFSHFTQNSMGVDFQDVNNDAQGDLIVLDMLAESNARQKSFATSMTQNQYNTWLDNGYGSQIMRNMLHLNTGEHYSDIGMLAGIEKTDWSWAPTLQDFNLDGQTDLFVSNGIKRDMSDMDFIVNLSDSMSKARNKGIEALTADNFNEWISLIPSTPLPNKLFLNDNDLTFTEIPGEFSGLSDSTFSQGTAVADFDNDGDLDLIINNSDQPALLYRNMTSGKNYLKINLSSQNSKTPVYGSTATLYASGTIQTRWLHASSGYMSSSQPILTFGIDTLRKVDSAVIKWPDGLTTVHKKLKINSTNEISKKKEHRSKSRFPVTDLSHFSVIDHTPEYRHEDDVFDEFRVDPLLIKMNSKFGPALCSGDVNNDGQDDFFIGGAAGQAGRIYLQNKNKFVSASQGSLESDASYEDTGACFFDLENDGDLDLYVVSGGSWSQDLADYEDRLYINDGKGNMKRSDHSFPARSGMVVNPADADNDGDIDLFVGNYNELDEPFKFPASYVWLNDQGKMKPVKIDNPGKIMDAVWVDLDRNELLDLILVGHWMQPKVFLHRKTGEFEEDTAFMLPNELAGYWNVIRKIDENRFFLGNEGLNIPFEISKELPFSVYYNDFDNNGDAEGIVTYVQYDKEWPYARKEVVAKEIPGIEKQFRTFKSYSVAPFHSIFDEQEIEEALVRKIFETRSGILIRGAGKWQFKPLANEGQISPLFDAIRVSDSTFLLAGNYRYNEVEIGPYDAGSGIMMDSRTYEVRILGESLLSGEIRHLTPLKLQDGNDAIIVAENDNRLKIIKRTK